MPKYKLEEVSRRYKVTKHRTFWEKLKTDAKVISLGIIFFGIIILIAEN